jgi:hypothetical protein
VSDTHLQTHADRVVSDLGISVQDRGVEAFNDVMAKRGRKQKIKSSGIERNDYRPCHSLTALDRSGAKWKAAIISSALAQPA